MRKETRCRHIGYSFRLTARVLLYAPSNRQDSTYHGLCYTSRGALAGTSNSCAPWSTINLYSSVHRPSVHPLPERKLPSDVDDWRPRNRPLTERSRHLGGTHRPGGVERKAWGWGIYSEGCFPFQPVVHNWFIKGRGMYCSVYGKVHIKDPLLLIEKSSLCGGSGFPSKKCVNVTIWMTSNNRW